MIFLSFSAVSPTAERAALVLPAQPSGEATFPGFKNDGNTSVRPDLSDSLHEAGTNRDQTAIEGLKCVPCLFREERVVVTTSNPDELEDEHPSSIHYNSEVPFSC